MSALTVDTPYGRLDRAALDEARRTFDSRDLLKLVDVLDALVAEIGASGGLRDDVLMLHAMTQTTLDGSGIVVRASDDALPELAEDVHATLLLAVDRLQAFRPALSILGGLAARE